MRDGYTDSEEFRCGECDKLLRTEGISKPHEDYWKCEWCESYFCDGCGDKNTTTDQELCYDCYDSEYGE